MVLLLCQGIVPRRKFAFLLLLASERAQNAHAGQVFARHAQHAVKPRLHLPIERNADDHDAEHHGEQNGDHDGKYRRGARVDGKRHDHRAKDHERRPERQPKRQIDAGLHLIHVARQPRQHRGRADRIQLRIGERLQVRKQRPPQARRRADRRLGRKILRRDRAQQPDQAQPDHHQAHPDDHALVSELDALIDHCRHEQRHQQLKARLQKLEQRAENALLPVCLELFQKMLHSVFLRSRKYKDSIPHSARFFYSRFVFFCPRSERPGYAPQRSSAGSRFPVLHTEKYNFRHPALTRKEIIGIMQQKARADGADASARSFAPEMRFLYDFSG